MLLNNEGARFGSRALLLFSEALLPHNVQRLFQPCLIDFIQRDEAERDVIRVSLLQWGKELDQTSYRAC